MLYPYVTYIRPSIRYLAFDVSDFLAEFGGLLGLLAGISVFSIIEFVMTILKCFRFAACKSKIVAPKAVRRTRRRRRKKFKVNEEHLLYHLSRTFLEFLKESNIHGLHYTNNKRLTKFERVFWFIIICLLLVFSSVLVIDSLRNLQSNSVIFTIDEKIWNVEDVRISQTLGYGDYINKNSGSLPSH